MIRYILKKDNRILLLLYDGKKCIEIRVYENSELPVIGEIMNCRVKDVAGNISAAFVDIGAEKNAFLSFDEINERAVFTKKLSKKKVVSGDEILLQVMKEPIGTKPHSMTSKISISGKGLVVFADKRNSLNISRKEKPDEEIIEATRNFMKESNRDFSVILRTNAASMTKAEITSELSVLYHQMTEILEDAPYRTAPASLYKPIPLWLSSLRDTRSTRLEAVVTDDKDIYELLDKNCNLLGIEKTKLQLYSSDYSLSKKIDLYNVIRDAGNKICWMKSGAYLVIEQTEALVSIDVNSGKAEKKHESEEFYLEINKEAALEAARQIRLKNLSGIILVDFINMKNDEDRNEVISVMSRAFAEDSIKTYIAGFTKLGLLEITREKKNRPTAFLELNSFLDS